MVKRRIALVATVIVAAYMIIGLIAYLGPMVVEYGPIQLRP